MANWATMFTQRSRLPTLPPGVDPRSEWFRCDRYECRLPKVQCANRYKLARGRTQEGLSYQATLYGGCHKCHVGAAHAAGLPTPPFAPTAATPARGNMEETTTSNGHSAKQYTARKCARCEAAFTPATGRERRCPACTGLPRKRNPPKAKRAAVKARGRRGKAPVEAVVLPPELAQPKPLSATTRTGVLKPSDIASPAEVLAMAGYEVQLIQTPAGALLRVL